jgi:hypothetical protein
LARPPFLKISAGVKLKDMVAMTVFAAALLRLAKLSGKMVAFDNPQKSGHKN